LFNGAFIRIISILHSAANANNLLSKDSLLYHISRNTTLDDVVIGICIYIEFDTVLVLDSPFGTVPRVQQ
jgi:hypothetical protein